MAEVLALGRKNVPPPALTQTPFMLEQNEIEAERYLERGAGEVASMIPVPFFVGVNVALNKSPPM